MRGGGGAPRSPAGIGRFSRRRSRPPFRGRGWPRRDSRDALCGQLASSGRERAARSGLARGRPCRGGSPFPPRAATQGGGDDGRRTRTGGARRPRRPGPARRSRRQRRGRGRGRDRGEPPRLGAGRRMARRGRGARSARSGRRRRPLRGRRVGRTGAGRGLPRLRLRLRLRDRVPGPSHRRAQPPRGGRGDRGPGPESPRLARTTPLLRGLRGRDPAERRWVAGVRRVRGGALSAHRSGRHRGRRAWRAGASRALGPLPGQPLLRARGVHGARGVGRGGRPPGGRGRGGHRGGGGPLRLLPALAVPRLAHARLHRGGPERRDHGRPGGAGGRPLVLPRRARRRPRGSKRPPDRAAAARDRPPPDRAWLAA